MRPAIRIRSCDMIGAVALLVLSVIVVAPVASAADAKTRRVNVSNFGKQALLGHSRAAAISANGRFVAFESDANHLNTHDTNGLTDVFVHDRKRRRTRQMSVHSDGTLSLGGGSQNPSISADGRFVAFESNADNLIDGDTNNARDIFVRDRKKGRTKRVSVHSSGKQATGGSAHPSISADGRFVAFRSYASDLVSNDGNGESDIFIHDRKKKRTRRVNVSSRGKEADGVSWSPAISGNGRFVAFWSAASNLIKNDTNDNRDIYVHDRRTKKTKVVSVRSNGKQVDGDHRGPALSGNGRYVAFESGAPNLVKGDKNGQKDVFVHDRWTGKTKRVSVRSNGAEANSDSDEPAFSADGRYVAFASGADNLVKGDSNGTGDIFVHDRKTKKTRRVSRHSNGGEANASSSAPALNTNGKFIAFESDASNLVGSDTNERADIFRRGPLK